MKERFNRPTSLPLRNGYQDLKSHQGKTHVWVEVNEI